MKPKLILQPDQFSSFTSWYLEPLWNEYFDIEIYNSSCSYSKETLFLFWWRNAGDPLAHSLKDQGRKVVVDNLWEKHDPDLDCFYQLNNSNWFWYNESLWWQALGYDAYTPAKTYKKLGLMPIRNVNHDRDWIVQKIKPWADNLLWSYRMQKLPNDDIVNGEVNQRYVNYQWYDDTCLSIVVETSQRANGIPISEKSYKPCAFYHPMLIIGRPGVLNFLKQQGFATFDNIFDESYDHETDFVRRVEMILENLNSAPRSYSTLTWEKLNHNRNHFFNKDLCRRGIVQEIINPLLEYAET